MKYKIFVSGVQKELKAERFAVKELVDKDILLRDYFSVFLFEKAPASSKSSRSTYLKEVRESEINLVIFGDEYGQVTKNKISATEEEFREAHKIDKYVLTYVKGKTDTAKDKRVQKLIAGIKDNDTGRKYARFETIRELKDAVHESLIKFLREKGIVGKTIFDHEICRDASWSDIDGGKVKWFLRIARAKRNFPLAEDTPAKDIFIHLNLLREGKLTNAAILLFGKNPHKFYLQAEAKCVQLSGTEVEKPFPSYQIYDGNLFDQIDRATTFVLSSIRLPVIQQAETAQVKRPPEIPPFAVQEAIVNAIAHRDYISDAGVQVMVFVDRVEIWNPGSLPSSLTISDLKRPHHSYPGNPLIASILYWGDYIQKVGSGTIVIVKQCKQAGLPEPEFVNNRGYEFRTILGRDIFTESALLKAGLNERQRQAVKLTKERGEIALSDLQKIYRNMTRKTLYRDLQTLVTKKVLKARGDRKGRKYSF